MTASPRDEASRHATHPRADCALNTSQCCFRQQAQATRQTETPRSHERTAERRQTWRDLSSLRYQNVLDLTRIFVRDEPRLCMTAGTRRYAGRWRAQYVRRLFSTAGPCDEANRDAAQSGTVSPHNETNRDATRLRAVERRQTTLFRVTGMSGESTRDRTSPTSKGCV